jgi:hypothetical protein
LSLIAESLKKNRPKAGGLIPPGRFWTVIAAKIFSNGYHVNALCISGQRMQSLASRLSQVLTALTIRHRFRVKSSRFRRAGYFHHRWPEEHAIQSLKLYRSE